MNKVNAQLYLVADLEQKKEDKLANEYAIAKQDLSEHELRMEALQEHKNQYMADVVAEGRNGVAITQMNRFQAFIAKLDQACTVQMSKVQTAKKVVEQRRALWLNQQRKRKAIEMVINKQVKAVQLHEDKQEQKMFDEFAMQQHFRKNL